MKTHNKELLEELQALSPQLAELKNQDDGFKVPPGYFENLADEVLDKIQEARKASHTERPQQAPIIGLHTRRRWMIGIAAAATIVLASALWLFNPQPDANTTTASLEQLPTDVLLDYIQENLAEFETEELVGSMDSELALPSVVPSTETDAIEEYLHQQLQDLDLADFEEVL